MITVQLPDPPSDVLRRLAAFGTDWRESKIPVELRRGGILGAGVAIQADHFTMTIRAARRSPNLLLSGIVEPAGDGGCRISGRLHLSTANQLMMGGGVLLLGALFWRSYGLITAVVACILLIAALAGLSAVGRTRGEREYEVLLEHAAGSHRDQAT